jgi:putative transposase
MESHPPKRRRSIRLQDYDYAQAGAYFVTICSHQRELFFDDPSIRAIAEDCWEEIPRHFPTVELDEWVVMPNHVHGILVLDDTRRGVKFHAPTRNPDNPFSMLSPQSGTLGHILQTYKSAVTRACRRIGNTEFAWQRNYHEHIVRNEKELNLIRQYVLDNPRKWNEDRYYRA